MVEHKLSVLKYIGVDDEKEKDKDELEFCFYPSMFFHVFSMAWANYRSLCAAQN